MVNGVGFTGGYSNLGQYYSQDFENIAKYTLGTTIVNGEASPFSGMGLMLGFAALPELWKGGQWLFSSKARNGKTISESWNKGIEEFKTDKIARQELFSNGAWKNADTYKTLWKNYSAKTTIDAIPTGEKLSKLSPEAQKAYSQSKILAEMAINEKTGAKELLKSADSALTKANALAYSEKLAKPAKGVWGNISRFFGKFTGYNKANQALKNLATESPVTSKILKFGKGNGWFVGITAGIELLTQIIPSFTQLGAGSGIKQIGKSAVKTGASVGGWVGGMAVGAAIGSVLPGAGTVIGGAIGALCGIIGGCLGSWAATKATEKIVGKDELELAKEKQAKQLAEEARQNPQAAQQLLAAAGEKLQAEGTESEDAKVAFGSLTRLAQNQPTNNEAQYTQNAPSFTGNENQQQTNATNPFKFNPKATSQVDYMDQDFMARGAGLV